MADPVTLPVRTRTVLGKKSESLRRQGVLPGVIFGGHKDSTPVETDARAFELGYRKWGATTLLTLEGIDGGQPALVASVARDPLNGKIIHVDFERVSLTEKTHAEVPLHFVGVAPALKAGGVVVHAKEHVRIEALPQDIPHQIDVDLTKIEAVDDALYIRDLVIDTTSIKLLDRPDDLVVKAVHQRVEEVAPTPAAAVPVEGAVVEGAEPVEGAAPAATGAKGAPAAAGAKGAPAAAGAKGAPAAAAKGAPAAPAKPAGGKSGKG